MSSRSHPIVRGVALALLAWAAAPSAAAAQLRPIAERSAATIVTIKDIRRVVMPDVVRVIIELDDEVEFHEDRLSDPPRVFVDLPSTRPSPSLVDRTLRFDRDNDPVRQIRIGRHPASTTRIVLDSLDISSYSVYPLYSPFRLIIDCVRPRVPSVGLSAEGAPAVPRAPATPLLDPAGSAERLLTARTLPRELSTRTPTSEPSPAVLAPTPPAVGRQAVATSMGSGAGSSMGAAEPGGAAGLPGPAGSLESAGSAASLGSRGPTGPSAPAVAANPIVPAPTVPALPPPAAARPGPSGSYSMARQLGLGVTRIVIDPGHGGHDPGAKGKGITEASLVLDVALRLEKLLLEIPGVEVVLTRRTDEFVPLPQRTAIANQENADLFLSIHANAHQTPSVRGVETYFLNFATNMGAAAVAARENAASGQTMGALPDIVRAIALNNKLDESRNLATQVQRALAEKLKTTNKGVRDMGVKQAPFLVLIGAAMPSVLAEVSFITNPTDAKLLQTENHRQRIAEALFTAVRRYQNSLKNVTTIAQQ